MLSLFDAIEATGLDVRSLSILAAASFAVLVFWHRDGRALGARSRPDLSTVPGIPLLGNLLEMRKHSGRRLEMWASWRAKNKDTSKCISVTIPGFPSQRLIDVTKPTWIEYLQKTNFKNYQKGKRTFEAMHDVLGEGIFVVDGDAWTTQRKATSKLFTTANFHGFITDAIQLEIGKLKVILGRYADSGEGFDLSSLLFRFTLESFGLMAFGTHIGALSLDSDAEVPYAAAFDYAQSVMVTRFTNPLWKITQHFNGQAKKMQEASKVMDEFVYRIIDQREKEGLGNLTRDDKKDVASKDLLSLYMALRDENGKPLSKKALRDSVMNLIIAGRDTTAQALSWTFFHLLRTPALLEPLRAEADEHSVVDYDTYKRMPQAQAAFHEGLRLHPSVPAAGWKAIGDDKLPDDGPFVQAGDVLRWGDWEMGRSTDVWGPDAAKFKPARWIDDKNELKKESHFKFHAFNGGYRLCLGQNLAIYEATDVLATIIRDFDLTFAPGYLESVKMVDCHDTPRYASSLTLPMAAPLLVTASRRPSSAPAS